MRQRAISRRIIGILAIGLILVLAGTAGVLNPVANLGGYITQPIQAAFSKAGSTVSSWSEVLTSAGSLEGQNRQLRNQVASLRQQLSQTTEIKAQNDELRQQLSLGPLPTSQLITAEVIGYQPDNFRQFITIDRGSRDGVKPGMAVVDHGSLLGTVSSVSHLSSKVFLVIDPNFRVAVLDQDESDRPTGTLHGQIGNGLEMDNVAQTSTLKPGDTIITSGLGGGLAKGLIVGHVQTVTKLDNGVFQTAQVTSDVEFSHLDIVDIVVPNP